MAMDMERGLFITVIGASDCSAEETRLAEEVGRELARRGVTLICGGLEGVMEAACCGAASQRGVTIGILPGNCVRMPMLTFKSLSLPAWAIAETPSSPSQVRRLSPSAAATGPFPRLPMRCKVAPLLSA